MALSVKSKYMRRYLAVWVWTLTTLSSSVSAASQAITFFIRTHLNRCEEQNDFPLLLRHVLSGTPKDDALAPALYSRTGGNVSHKDRMARDENGNLKERVTCFRRGTTVWYLSKACGAPCPFARVGIALRDYSEGSSITYVEGRKGDSDFSRGLKRKREHNLRRRAGSGPAARRPEDDSDVDERRKPPKIKLTLRLRPNPTSLREKSEREVEETSSSSSDSESDAEDERMDVDTPARSPTPPPSEPSDEPYPFPPYPISRRIDIPSYTPSEYVYPNFYKSPTYTCSSSGFFSEWPPAPRPLACIEPSAQSRSRHQRESSVSFSIASPPPDSDDEFDIDDDDDEEAPASMSPEMKIKREDELSYVWPQAAPSTSSLDLPHIKSEPFDDDVFDAAGSKRSSTHTVKQEAGDDFSLDLSALNFGDGESDFFGFGVAHQDDGLFGFGNGSSWDEPVDLTFDEPVQSTAEDRLRAAAACDNFSWRSVKLLGPETIDLKELDENDWDERCSVQDDVSTDQSSTQEGQLALQHEEEPKHPPTPSRSRASTVDSLSSPPSLAGWSVCSPDTELESVGPASPLSFAVPESPIITRSDEAEAVLRAGNGVMARSSPMVIPGKASASLAPSRQAAAAIPFDDVQSIPLSEDSAPWERGMFTEADVEKHLLEPPRPMLTMALSFPTFKIPLEEMVPEPPLSPQEEAVFQSLCIWPDSPSEDERKEGATKEETMEVAMQDAPSMTDLALTSVIAAATRPTMRLRERRPSRRPEEVEQARKQTEMCNVDAEGLDDAGETDSGTSSTPRKREKCAASLNDVDATPTGRGPLRRSKRVANATAMQRNRERLRKRAVS